jgi:hypothetical protein
MTKKKNKAGNDNYISYEEDGHILEYEGEEGEEKSAPTRLPEDHEF